jgi:hypothetical protein
VLIGPILGEFGYEVMTCQAAIRHFLTCERHKYDKVIVGCREGNEYMYELATDFYFPKEFSLNTQANCSDGKIPHFPEEIVKKYSPCIQFPINTIDQTKQNFIKFGVKFEYKECWCKYDVLFHARNSHKYSTARRNWLSEKWVELQAKLWALNYKMGSIGTMAEAEHIGGTDDLRGLPLNVLCDVIASSKVVAGPSSGAMHLTSLCGTPHVVWCNTAGTAIGKIAKNSTRDRYEVLWNPLKSKAVVIDSEGWNPSVETVCNAIRKEVAGENFLCGSI